MTDQPRRKGCLACLTIAALAIVAGGAVYGPVIRDFWKEGILQSYLFPEKKRRYEGDTIANLRAQHTALLLYHESEGQFPEASGWMDAIENRLRTADMDKEEALKKLRRPDLQDQPDAFGYAMNDAASARYKEDIPEPAKTPLTFESSNTERNAHGPASGAPKGAHAVSVEGGLLRL